ncbi:MAG: tail fiber domain-containing protein [Rudaea sp.]|nr:tail fiber domain-containing protein [Rudaea sp.]
MKRALLSAALVAALVSATGTAAAASFTYHGSLQDGGKPADGSYDIELTLYSAPSGGSVIGGPLIMNKVAVHNGSFSTQADFGPLAKSFSQAFVSTSVRSAGQGEFVSLDTRAQVSVSPASSVCPGAWTLDGNAGNPSGSYLGTADTQPLTFEVAATQVGQITTSSDPTSPNVIFGSSGNVTTGNIGGATISGGGNGSGGANSVGANFATIGGGLINTASGTESVIGGGGQNNSTGFTSTVCGGNANTAGAQYAVVGGGNGNQATGTQSTVGGGNTNVASNGSATVGGGTNNTASGGSSTVAGGNTNTASGERSTVAGGNENVASGGYATVGGGGGNTAGGDFSFAGGFGAVARDAAGAGNSGSCTAGQNCGDYGTFVWQSAQGSDSIDLFKSTGPEQFLIKAGGGVAINGQPLSITGNVPNLSIYGNAASGGYAYLTLAPTSPLAGSNGIGQFGVYTSAPSANVGQFEIENLASGASLVLDNSGNLTITGSTAYKPGGGSWTATSDRRIKQDITTIHDALDTVMKLRPVNFHYTPEYRAMEGGLADKPYQGFIAQEFADVFPEAVISTDKHIPGAAASDEPILALDPNPALITTVAAVQELAVHDQAGAADIATLKQENADLRRKLDDVVARLSKLEAGQGE